MNADVATLIIALFSGGGIAAVITAVTSWRKGIRETDVARDQTAIQGFKDLAESLRGEVERLKTAREEDRARLDRIEQQITVERDLRWSAIQYVRVLLAWVSQHLPGVTPPSVPADLADHVIYTPSASTPEEPTP